MAVAVSNVKNKGDLETYLLHTYLVQSISTIITIRRIITIINNLWNIIQNMNQGVS